MRKYQAVLNESTPRPKRSHAPKAIAFALALLVAPLVYEGGLVILDRWLSMTGAHREPHTPILDAISQWSQTSGREFSYYYGRLFENGSWSASTAVPIGIAWAVLMSFIFLRRTQ